MKIDTTKIPNFDTLPDEVKSAITGMELAPDLSGYVEKTVFDRKASEASELSKKLREKMSEDEQKKADNDKAFEDMKAELDKLRRNNTISAYKAEHLAMGYDEELAGETAEALADGKYDIVFANQKKHIEMLKKAASAERIANNPVPPAGADAPVNYTKLIDDANATGDMARVAALLRQQQEANFKK